MGPHALPRAVAALRRGGGGGRGGQLRRRGGARPLPPRRAGDARPPRRGAEGDDQVLGQARPREPDRRGLDRGAASAAGCRASSRAVVRVRQAGVERRLAADAAYVLIGYGPRSSFSATPASSRAGDAGAGVRPGDLRVERRRPLRRRHAPGRARDRTASSSRTPATTARGSCATCSAGRGTGVAGPAADRARGRVRSAGGTRLAAGESGRCGAAPDGKEQGMSQYGRVPGVTAAPRRGLAAALGAQDPAPPAPYRSAAPPTPLRRDRRSAGDQRRGRGHRPRRPGRHRPRRRGLPADGRRQGGADRYFTEVRGGARRGGEVPGASPAFRSLAARRAGGHQLPGLHRRLLLDRARSRQGAPRADGRPGRLSPEDRMAIVAFDGRTLEMLHELVELELRARAGVQEGDRAGRPSACSASPSAGATCGGPRRSASRNHRPRLAGRQPPRRRGALLRRARSKGRSRTWSRRPPPRCAASPRRPGAR